MIDPRLVAFLACAWEHKRPYYAAAAYTLARQIGDKEAMRWALELGAADWRPSPKLYATTEDDMLDQIAVIPDDLAGLWFWQGRFLRLKADPLECGVAICTVAFPPPICFKHARRYAKRESVPTQINMFMED